MIVAILEKKQPRADARRIGPLLASTGISVTGDGAFIAAAPLLASTLTRNPVAISAVTASFYIPWLLFGLPAGALTDRWPRRHVMLIADLLRGCLLAYLAMAAALNWVSAPLLIATVFIVAAAQCFFDSAAQAAIPALVGRDREILNHVNGQYWALDTTGRSLLGPPLGSLAFAAMRTFPFLIDCISFLASAAFVSRLPNMPPPRTPRSNLVAEIRQGLRHLLQAGDLRLLAFSVGIYNFASNVGMGIFVLYARVILSVPPAAYGALLAVSAVGGISVGWRARPVIRHLSFRWVMVIANLIQAVTWLGIAAVGNLWMTGVCMLLMGSSATLANVTVSSTRQALTPDSLLARVVAAFRVFGTGSAGLGALAGGIMARFYGLSATLVVAAAIFVVGAVLAWPYRHS
jgi:predicted MFS family arabinose efflux permease